MSWVRFMPSNYPTFMYLDVWPEIFAFPDDSTFPAIQGRFDQGGDLNGMRIG